MSLNATGLNRYIKVLPWLFTASFIFITFLPRSLDDTMFMDGVTYAAISRNMSIGIGSFWRPFFAHSFWLPYDNNGFFSGHPPLQFGLQAILFRIMGDTPAVEIVYNLLILLGYLVVIIALWKKLLSEHPEYRPFAWIPILCWYGMVIVYYGMPNNFLDSTMGLFCLLSCYFQLCFLKLKKITNGSYLWPFIGGICIFLAFLTKGPVGLYPFAFSIIYAMFHRATPFSTSLKSTIVMLFVFAAILSGVLAYQPARDFLGTYFNGQVVQALLQKREKTGTGLAAHFTLLVELARNLYPHLIVLAALYIPSYRINLKTPLSAPMAKTSQFAFLIAFSGIAPMLVSVKQYPHYLLPALPFVALFFGFLMIEKIAALMFARKRMSILLLGIGCFLCWGLTAAKFATDKPDIVVQNAKDLRQMVPRGSTIGICHDLYQNADIHANFQRYHRLSLTESDTARYVFGDSSCLPKFDAQRDSIIPMHGKYLLIIRQSRHR
jgi:hypothetical protein